MIEEEKVSARRRGKDLHTVERHFHLWDQHWHVLTVRARVSLACLCAGHLYTSVHLFRGFYHSLIDADHILPALASSMALAWFVLSGRCSHLNGLTAYKGRRSRALERLCLQYESLGEGEGGRNGRGKLVRRNYESVEMHRREAVKFQAIAAAARQQAVL